MSGATEGQTGEGRPFWWVCAQAGSGEAPLLPPLLGSSAPSADLVTRGRCGRGFTTWVVAQHPCLPPHGLDLATPSPQPQGPCTQSTPAQGHIPAPAPRGQLVALPATAAPPTVAWGPRYPSSSASSSQGAPLGLESHAVSLWSQRPGDAAVCTVPWLAQGEGSRVRKRPLLWRVWAPEGPGCLRACRGRWLQALLQLLTPRPSVSRPSGQHQCAFLDG